MTDATNPPAPPPGADTVPQTTGGTSFLASTRGKLVAGGAVLALLVLAAVVGAAIYLFGGALLSNPGGTDDGSTGRTPSVATTAAAPAAPAVNPPRKPLSSSFTFRNVFAPTIMPPSVEISTQPAPVEVAEPVETPTGDTPTPVTPATTLTLLDIITEGDAHKGVFTYGTLTQTAGNGEVIGDSPWQVLEVGEDSVLMLFGDTQVTISIGQGIAK